MRRSPWAAVAAIAIAVAFLALAVPTSGVAETQTASPHPASSLLSRPLTGTLKTAVLRQASAAAGAAGLSAQQESRLLAEVGGMSPDQIASAVGLSPAVLSADLTGGQSEALCLASPLGCVLAYAAGALAFQYASNQADNQVLTAYTNWSNAMVRSAWNEANITAAGTSNLLSALNFSLPGFERMAEDAAMSQIGNATYNIPLDEYQSGLAAQFASIYGSYSAQEEAIGKSLVGWFLAQTGTNSEFAAVTPMMDWGGFGSDGAQEPPSGSSYQAGWNASAFEPWPALIQPSLVYLPPGTSFVWLQNVMTSSATWTITSVLNPSVTTSPSDTSSGGAWVNESLPASFSSGGVFTVSVVGSGLTFDELSAPGAAEVPQSSSQSVGGVPGSLYGYGYGVAAGYRAGIVNDANGGQATGNPVEAIVLSIGTTVSLGTGSTYTAYTPTAQLTANPIGYNYAAWLGALEYKAAVSGEVYWSFLRSVGYTSPSQIAPDCIVPMPYQVLPSDLNLGNLTMTELQTLYLAWLQGLGNFYNVTLSAVNFCGTQSHHQFHLGGAIWGNLQINATGDVYLNNGTSPIALNGTALKSELYGNLSTWALTHEQLLLMPTLGTVHIPVGVKWQVPAGNPIEIYAVQAGQMLTTRGNGTGSNGSVTSFVPLGTAAPGDSLYLTSCIVGGVVQTSCTVTVQTINTTVGNISCGLNASGLGSCHTVYLNGGGTFGGLPNPFTWLAGLFSGLFGGGSLGSFLGSLVAGLVILEVIAVLVYVAVTEVAAWGGRKRGGGGGGGGSTVVVTGGR